MSHTSCLRRRPLYHHIQARAFSSWILATGRWGLFGVGGPNPAALLTNTPPPPRTEPLPDFLAAYSTATIGNPPRNGVFFCIVCTSELTFARIRFTITAAGTCFYPTLLPPCATSARRFYLHIFLAHLRLLSENRSATISRLCTSYVNFLTGRSSSHGYGYIVFSPRGTERRRTAVIGG